jgi:hypothetical protein
MLLPMEFSSRTLPENRLAPVMELLRRQTFVTDSMGFFIFLGLATLVLIH